MNKETLDMFFIVRMGTHMHAYEHAYYVDEIALSLTSENAKLHNSSQLKAIQTTMITIKLF